MPAPVSRTTTSHAFGVGIVPDRERDAAAAGRVPDGVGDHVGQDTAHRGRVDPGGRATRRRRTGQRHACDLRGLIVGHDHLVEQGHDVRVDEPEVQPPDLRERDRPNVLHQPSHRARLREQRRESFGVRGVDAVGDRLELALKDRERRPQLVRHVGEEGAPPRVAGLEAGAHLVEGSRQRAHLAGCPPTSTRTL